MGSHPPGPSLYSNVDTHLLKSNGDLLWLHYLGLIPTGKQGGASDSLHSITERAVQTAVAGTRGGLASQHSTVLTAGRQHLAFFCLALCMPGNAVLFPWWLQRVDGVSAVGEGSQAPEYMKVGIGESLCRMGW